MGIVSAVAVGHGRQQPLAVFAALELNLRDPRKITAKVARMVDRVAASLDFDADLWRDVRIRPLTPVRIASVENRGAIRQPSRTAAAGGILHARNCVRHFGPGVHLEEMQRTLLAAAFRQRNRHPPPIGRWHVPIDRRRAVGVVTVEIKHRTPHRLDDERDPAV